MVVVWKWRLLGQSVDRRSRRGGKRDLLPRRTLKRVLDGQDPADVHLKARVVQDLAVGSLQERLPTGNTRRGHPAGRGDGQELEGVRVLADDETEATRRERNAFGHVKLPNRERLCHNSVSGGPHTRGPMVQGG